MVSSRQICETPFSLSPFPHPGCIPSLTLKSLGLGILGDRAVISPDSNNEFPLKSRRSSLRFAQTSKWHRHAIRSRSKLNPLNFHFSALAISVLEFSRICLTNRIGDLGFRYKSKQNMWWIRRRFDRSRFLQTASGLFLSVPSLKRRHSVENVTR
jgi:hypothetical protein